MIGVLIIAHGTLGESLVGAVTHVLGARPSAIRRVLGVGQRRSAAAPAQGARRAGGDRHGRRRAGLLRHLRRDALQPRHQAAAARPRRRAWRASTCRCSCGPSPIAARAWTRWSRRRSPAAATACCTSRSIPCMQQREVEIVNKLGLHARASAKLTQLAARFQSDVQIARNGRKREREEHHGRDDARRRQGPQRDDRDRRSRRGRRPWRPSCALIGDYFGEGQ